MSLPVFVGRGLPRSRMAQTCHDPGIRANHNNYAAKARRRTVVSHASLLAMTSRYDSAFPRRNSSGSCQIVPPGKGRGECRAPRHPQPRVDSRGIDKTTRVSHHGRTGLPSIPARNGLRFASCSPRRSGFFDTVADGINSANLTPTSRRQDHTLSPSASARSRLKRPFASTASRPASVTIARAPLCVGRDGGGDTADLSVL
jgi:hypothetical protein